MASSSAKPKAWSIDYTPRDWEIVDYQFYEMPSMPGILLRGPKLDLTKTGDYFSCIGAAQTMGVYVQKPFPELLSDQLGLPAMNLAVGAAGPGFYAAQDELIALVNKSRFLILQVMSSRSESNSRMEQTGYIELVRDRQTGEVLGSGQAWTRLLGEGQEQVRKCVAENQQHWLEHYQQLLAKVTVPVILFWFSSKPQDTPINFNAQSGPELMGAFPQFVDAAGVKALEALCTANAASYSARNAGHQLVSRFTGQPVEADYGKLHESMRGHVDTHNFYYPSPEMHEDAAAVLLPTIRALAQQHPHMLPKR